MGRHFLLPHRGRMKSLPLCLLLFASCLLAQEQAYWSVPLRELVPADKLGDGWSRDERIAVAMWPRVTLEGGGQGRVRLEEALHTWQGQRRAIETGTLLVRAEAGKPVKGRLFVPDADFKAMLEVPFTLPADGGQTKGRLATDFATAEVEQLAALLGSGVPGGAWFRYRHTELCKQHGLDEAARQVRLRRNEELYDLFSGGRALAENLQLERGLRVVAGGDPSVDVETIPGIKIKAIDWAKHLPKQPPESDPLAKLIPHDQHAIFMPTFQALLTLSDEADKNGTPVLQTLEPRAEDARVSQRYERQLCIGTSGLGRLLGPHLISSIAITGSDPYLRVGADIAVLFAAKDADTLEKLLVTQTRLLAKSDASAQPTEGTCSGIAWAGIRSQDRRVCSHVARLGDAVVVTNSVPALERLVATFQRRGKSLAELEEYTFFRARYPRSDTQETALAVLSDATIRRWCSPRWRIADARRTRALALIADANCAHLKEVASAGDEQTALPALSENSDLGSLVLSRGGVRSSIYGNLEFATPILELDTAKVTTEEKTGYEIWRTQYEQAWRGFFDPIALRISIGPKRLSGDLTVMPLIAGSEYQDWIQICHGVEIRPESVDLHDALSTFTIAINREAKDIRSIAGFLAGFSARGENVIDPLGWMGTTFSIHADDDPFWKDLAAATDTNQFLARNWHRLPFMVQIESVSVLKLTAFLAAARAALEGTAPGMVRFTTQDHQGQGYVRVGPSEQTQKEMREVENLAVYYAASGDALLVTLSEAVMKHALERRAVRRAARAESRPATVPGSPVPGSQMLGKSVCLQAKAGMLEPWRLASGEVQRDQLRGLCWGNLPILEEWHRLFPNEDPVAVHERLFATRLLDPSGGVYVWNPKLGCMESSTLGCPSDRKRGPDGIAQLAEYDGANFGITFEADGLRARVEIDRK